MLSSLDISTAVTAIQQQRCLPATRRANNLRVMARKPLTDEQIEDAKRLKDAWLDYRARTKTTQEQIAAACGFTQSAFTQYINGHVALNLNALLEICSVIKVSPTAISPSLTKLLPPQGLLSEQVEAPKSEADDLVADWEALPEGWRYYICRKTRQLRESADSLPDFLKESLRKIPEDADYWRWEREIADFVYKRNGIVQDNGYIGRERRERDSGHEPNRRQFGLEGDTGGKGHQSRKSRSKRGAA